MTTAARNFIEAIACDMTEIEKPLSNIIDFLNDGQALADFGATDEDQEMIEDAHALVSGWIESGLTTLNQVKAGE